MERTTGNSRPQDVQVSLPSARFPLFSIEAVENADSARRDAPQAMHLSHSTDSKFIQDRCSLIYCRPIQPNLNDARIKIFHVTLS